MPSLEDGEWLKIIKEYETIPQCEKFLVILTDVRILLHTTKSVDQDTAPEYVIIIRPLGH